jgi:hypothetical protein
MCAVAFGVLVAVQCFPQFAKQVDIPRGLLFRSRILVVNVEPVQSIIFQDFDRRLDELGPGSRVDDYRMEGRRISPSSDTEQDFEVPVLLFELVNGFEVAVEVGAGVIPGVSGIMDVLICP